MDCKCKWCTNGCLYKPGWFNFGQIEEVAKFLGITVKELFDEYLAVDYWASAENPIFVIAPAVDTIKTGVEYPLDPHGRCVCCVFYDEAIGCKIHAVKPAECAFVDHDKSREECTEFRNTVRDSWLGKTQIKELLGREPEQPIPNPLDVLSMLLGSLKRELLD